MGSTITFRPADWRTWVDKHGDHAARSRTEYELHLAAHEWALGSSLDINSRRDFQSLDYINVEPFNHQVENAILFFRRLSPRGLIADDVGLGKTITAGLIAAELLERGRIESILVVGPKPILYQWQEELLTKFGINANAAVGQQFSDLKKHPHWITTYATARSKMDLIKSRKFDLVILDEAHALRNLYSDPPPQTALRFRELMLKEGARFVLMLTATPIQNRLWDIYSLLDICRTPQPNPLGSPQHFASTYVADHPVARQLRQGTRDDFRRRVAEATIRTRRSDTDLLFPTREIKDERLQPNADERAFLDEALETILELPVLAQITHARTLMSSPWAAAAAFERAGTGPQYSPALRQRFQALAARGRSIKTSAKIDRVLKFAEQLKARAGHPRLIVFTTRVETLNHLYSALSAAGFADQASIFRGGQDDTNRRAVAEFMADPPTKPILLSTDAGAVGINLQAGNVVINYDLPWNPMLVEQRIGRVQRLGQRAEKVIVYNLVLAGTIEDRIVLRLMEKLSLFNQAIGEMEELLEFIGLGEDDNAKSFEDVILDLIRKSAQQIDVESQLRAMEASRKAAEAKLKEMREATDSALKSIKPEDGQSRLQNLPRITPRLALEPFVQGMLENKFSEVRAQGDGRFLARNGLNWEAYVIGRSRDASTDGPRAMTPGTRHFERLAEPLRTKVAHHVLDGSNVDEARLAETLARHAEHLGLVAGSVSVTSTSDEVTLTGSAKVTARVSTDQYETLVEAKRSIPEHQAHELLEAHIQGVGTGLTALPSIGTTWNKHANAIDGLDEADILERDGVQQFCDFYLQRRDEEQGRLAAQPLLPTDARKRAADVIDFRFSPEVTVEPISLAGLTYKVVNGMVHLRGREQAESFPLPYSGVPLTDVVLSFPRVEVSHPWVCPGRHVVDQSQFVTCVIDGCTKGSCHDCIDKVHELAACGTCSSYVCREHKLNCVACQRALCPEHALTVDVAVGAYCAECTTVLDDGRRVPISETAGSPVSRRHGLKKEMIQSGASDRWGFPDELARCEESGDLVFPDELVRCGVTGKQVKRPLTEVSEVSGRRALRNMMHKSPLGGGYFLPDEVVQCGETGEFLSPKDVGRCSETGRLVRKDLLGTDEVQDDKVLRRLLHRSDLSGRWAREANTELSNISNRRGLSDEVVNCDVCHKRVLTDEVACCPETGLLACLDHFLRCELTGQAVLPNGLARCEVSNKLVARSLLSFCPDSGLRLLTQLMELCDETDMAVAPSALGRCEVTGARVRRALLAPCEVTARLALPETLANCTVSGKRVLPSLLIECPETGTKFLPEFGEKCEATGTLCAPTGIANCEVTGKRVRQSLLASDDVDGRRVQLSLMGRCQVSGKMTDASRLLTCTATGLRSLPELMSTCAVSSRPVLPSALEACSLSGALVHPDLLLSCPETGIRLLQASAVRCEATGARVAPQGTGQCSETDKTVRSSLLQMDEVTRQPVLASLLRTCEKTGRRTTAHRLVRSAVSGKEILAEIAAVCAVSKAFALPEELGTCTVSGERVLPSLMGTCEESGDPVARHRLQTCQASGASAKAEFFDHCTVTGKRVLKKILKASAVSGALALESAMQPCDATGCRVLPSELVSVEFNAKRVLASRLVQCHACGRTADTGDVALCKDCNQRTCPDHLHNGVCASCKTLESDGLPLSSEEAQALERAGIRYRSKTKAESALFVHILLKRWRLFKKSERRLLVLFRGTWVQDPIAATVVDRTIAPATQP